MNEVYIEEVPLYMRKTRRDDINDRLTELAIVHNPNAKNPKRLVSIFKKALAELDGKSYVFKEKMSKKDEQALREVAKQMKANARKRRA